MRKISTLMYCIRQGFTGFRKNRMFTLASIGTVAACLFLFGLFYFAISNFRHAIDTTEQSVGISVFFEEGIGEDSINEMGEAILSMPEVDHVEFISAQQAWETFKEENFQDTPELAESFGEDNPLADSASYSVYLKKIDDQDELSEKIGQLTGVRLVKRSSDLAQSLSDISGLAGLVSAGLILVLVLVSVFLIHSAVAAGISVRKQEIAIMRLMGASDFFIRAPFIVEGLVIGFLGSVIPLLILAVSYGRITRYVTEHFSVLAGNITFLGIGREFSLLVPASLILGIGIGLFGSFFTVHRNLNV